MIPKTPRSQAGLLEAANTCQATLDETSRLLAEIKMMLLEINRKLDALMEHLGVPYEKPRVRSCKD